MATGTHDAFVTYTTAIQVPADTVSQKKITNQSGGTLYYKNADSVSSSSNDGNLTAGQSVSITTSNWIVSTTAVNTLVEETAASPAFTDVTASDDITVGDDITVTDKITIGGALDHDGTTVGFYGTAPGTQASAYTQTYSTASKTVPVATAAAVATTGATQTTPFGYAGAPQADAIPVAINANAADILAVKKVVTALIDDLQAIGLVL